MEQRELVRDMVTETRQTLANEGWAVGKEKDIDDPKGRSVSVKIRVHKDLRYVQSASAIFANIHLDLIVLIWLLEKQSTS